MYVMAGPAEIGSLVGHYGYKIPEDKCAIVEDAHYLNCSGSGPCLAVKRFFDNVIEAENCLDELLEMLQAKVMSIQIGRRSIVRRHSP